MHRKQRLQRKGEEKKQERETKRASAGRKQKEEGLHCRKERESSDPDERKEMRKALPEEWLQQSNGAAPERGEEEDEQPVVSPRGGKVKARTKLKAKLLGKSKKDNHNISNPNEDGEARSSARRQGEMETARGKMSVSGPIRSMHRIHVDAELVWSPFGGGADEQVAGGRDMFALDDEPIGQGAFGKVFRATHRSGFQLAIKEIDLSILDRMSLAGGVSVAEEIRLGITQGIPPNTQHA